MRRVPVIVACLALSSCGSSTREPARPVASPPPQWCPMGTKRFNATILLGRGIEPARRLAKQHGCTVRITEGDGAPEVITADLVLRRIDVKVTDGRVRSVEIG